MRRWSITLLLLLVGCSKAAPEGGSQTADVQKTPAPGVSKAGVDVGPTLVPGIALTYGYEYLLPIAQVQPVLEKHAAQCEALGPQKCRIIGLRYHAGRNRSISASLDMKLAPEGARAFGKQATAAVVAGGGMLTDSEITSVEAGAAAEKARAAKLAADTERADLQRQLERTGLPAVERQQLQARIVALRDNAQGSAGAATDAAALLASTPMHIGYTSGTVDPGYADGPIRGALRDGWANIVAGTAMILEGAITLLPWALALFVLILLVRLARRYLDRWTARRS